MKRNHQFTAIALAVAAMALILIGCSDPTEPEPEPEPKPTIPGTPTGLTSLTHTETSIAVTWNAVNGADKYHVYAGTVAGSLTRRGSPTSASYLITGLSANITYYIEVSAENGAGEGKKSTAITVTTSLSVKPASPSGLTIRTITENSIAITWDSVSGASSYKVFAGTTAADMTLRGNPTTASFTITGLTANTTYYIAVSTRTDSNESDQSISVTAKTSAGGQNAQTEVTIAMWDSGSDGWDTSAALRVNVNGTDRAQNARLATGGGPGYYTFFVDTGDVVQIYWVNDGQYDNECAFAVYYSNNPPNPSFNPSTGTSDSTRVLLSKRYNNPSGAVGNGALMGSFFGGGTVLPTRAITSFRFADFSVNGTINGPNITITVPNIVNLTALVPTIVYNGKSISPASGVAQDFSSPVPYLVTAEDNSTQNYFVTVTVANTTLATAFAWINSYSGSTRTFTIIAQADESLAPVTINPNYSNVNIILSGGTTEKTITNSSASLFSIRKGTLTLNNNITLQGGSPYSISLVYLDYSSNLVMNTGAKIINNTITTSGDSAYGGGVSVIDGTFTMNGGTISGNRVEALSSSSSYSSDIGARGGGVYVGNYGTFIMNDGTISGNTVYSEKYAVGGGGVYVRGGTFTLVNGTISNNTADSRAVMASSYAYGGGVAVWTSGTFTMQGGTIRENQAVSSTGVLATSYYYGGGVYVDPSNNQFRKTGGTIYGSNGTTAQQNLAKDRTSSSIGTTSGHAVYAGASKRRNTTAGTAVNLDSSKTGSAGGWE